MAIIAAIWDSLSQRFELFFIYKSPLCFLSSFESIGLSFQKKGKIYFQDGHHLGFPIGTILAIFISTSHPNPSYQFSNQLALSFRKISETRGPRATVRSLSDIATADMQMLCNIFPILSSQLMKISSFEQFLVLKKDIWAWQSMEHDHLNKLSIIFQQKDQCEIWWKLAKWFLKNHDFIHVNSTVAGKYYKYKPDDGHLRFPIRTILTTVDLQVTSILSI